MGSNLFAGGFILFLMAIAISSIDMIIAMTEVIPINKILPSYSEIADSGYTQTYLDLWDCSNHGILLSASEAQLKELKNSRKYRIIYIDDVSNEVIPNQL